MMDICTVQYEPVPRKAEVSHDSKKLTMQTSIKKCQSRKIMYLLNTVVRIFLIRSDIFIYF
jgi:hypothetical protein